MSQEIKSAGQTPDTFANQHPIKCRACSGTGKIDPCIEGHPEILNDCEDCGGTGQLWTLFKHFQRVQDTCNGNTTRSGMALRELNDSLSKVESAVNSHHRDQETIRKLRELLEEFAAEDSQVEVEPFRMLKRKARAVLAETK